MIFLYIVLQSENQKINLGGACEHLKTAFKCSNGRKVELSYQFLSICMGGADTWVMETHIALDETVVVYNIGEVSS